MNPNAALLWFVGFATLLLLFRSWRARPRLWGWFTLSVLVTLVAGGAAWLSPSAAGWVAIAVWGPLIMSPMLLRLMASRALSRRRYTAAARWGRAMALLHPVDHWPALARLMHGLRQAQRGQHRESAETFSALASSPLAGWQARVYQHALNQQWEAIALMGPRLPAAAQSIVLRALGEAGMRDEMIAHFAAMKGFGPDQPAELRMVLAAFTGRPDVVRRLHRTALSRADEASRRFWVATAEQVAGNHSPANAEFALLAQGDDRIIAAAAERRVEQPLESVSLEYEEELASELRQTLQAAWRTTRRDDALATLVRPSPRPARATWALLAVLAAWFTAQALSGGVDNPHTLMRMGAMRAPAADLDGEYWRLLTAGWLHFGWPHWVVNAFGLWIFGRFVESVSGRGRMVAVYLLSGVAAMATWLGLSWGAAEPQAVVGASASVMGLVGATVVLLALRRRSRLGGRRTGMELGFIVVMVGLQAAFDLSVPQSSFIGHVAGFGWGVLLALLLPSRRTGRAPADGT